jgi:leucyl aminopeptidase (aminopeptidase T)
MKFFKIGATEEWHTIESLSLESHGAKHTGIKLEVLAQEGCAMTVSDGRTVDDQGQPVEHFFPVPGAEVVTIDLKLKGGGIITFSKPVNVRTRNLRGTRFEVKGPVFVRPMRERVRDPQAELVAAIAKQNEERRKKAEFKAFEEQQKQIKSLLADLEEMKKDAKAKGVSPDPKAPHPADPPISTTTGEPGNENQEVVETSDTAPKKK